MTSLIFLGCFEKFLDYTVFLPSFIVVRHQMAELTWGAFCPPPPIQYRGSLDPIQNRAEKAFILYLQNKFIEKFQV